MMSNSPSQRFQRTRGACMSPKPYNYTESPRELKQNFNVNMQNNQISRNVN